MARIVLGTTKHPVRFSYAHVFEKSSMGENDRECYSVAVLIDKKDKVSLAKYEKALEDAKQYGKEEKWDNKIPKSLMGPLRDGDDEYDDGNKGPEYQGKMFLNAKSFNKRPEVVDEDRNEILDPEDFYSGCYGRVSIDLYPYNTNGNKGVAAGLGNLQKLKDGENLGAGGSTAEDDFADDLE